MTEEIFANPLVETTDTAPAPETQQNPDPVHPFAEAFPMLEGEELNALVEDIQTNGLLHPIVTDQNGQVIDGRNRLRACRLAGVEAITPRQGRLPTNKPCSAPRLSAVDSRAWTDHLTFN